MQSGKLRHQIVIQQRSAGSPQRTASGAPDASWTTLATLYASIEPLTGKRLESAQATWPKATVEVRVRYSSDLWTAFTAGTLLRVSHGGLFYPIEGLLNWQLRNIELRLMCSQGAARG